MPSLTAMAGSSIAGRDAAPWVTDFLNAAYFRRRRREVEDLRLAFCSLTTSWGRRTRGRLRATDLPAFVAAFGTARLRGLGTLDRAALEAGGERLLGDWFPAAAADPERRGWGIAFPDATERAAYDPARRWELAQLGELTPPSNPGSAHTYDPVALPSAEAALALLGQPERWPDFASETGRFTPLRDGGLDGQTFEIEVVVASLPVPVYTRGYVTATRVGDPEPWTLPDGARGLAAIELTTHAGHFLGPGISRLVVYEDDAGAWIRDVGVWDPLPPALAVAYKVAGRAAQEAFWGTDERRSMLVQLARATA